MGLGCSKAGVFTALIPCLPMFFSTWETYHTHTLYLGYFNGPTEGLIIACLLMIFSGYYGPEIWTLPVAKLIGFSSVFGELSMLDLWVPVISASFFIAHLPACVVNVVRARRRQDLPVLPVFLEWAPIIVFSFAACGWLFSPHTTLVPTDASNHLILFCVTMSFVFGRMTTKIILAHLTKQPFPYWTVLMAPLVGGAILFNLLPSIGLGSVSPTFELWYLRGYFVFATVAYFHWAVIVIDRICAFLGINCLTIKSQSASSLPTGRRRTSVKRDGNGSMDFQLKRH